jgi:FkbM family methyltransferase
MGSTPFDMLETSYLDYMLGEPAETDIGTVLKQAITLYPCGVQTALMLDIGANGGLFGTMAAVAGCRVHFFEPQPACMFQIHLQAIRNGLEDRVELHTNFVSDDTGKTIIVHNSGCSAGFISKTNHQQVSEPKWRTVRTGIYAPNTLIGTTLDSLFVSEEDTSNQPITFVKIDTEGSEVFIMKGAVKLLASRRVKFWVLEVSGGFQQETGSSLAECVDMLMEFFKQGYRGTFIGPDYYPVLRDTFVHAPMTAKGFESSIRRILPNDRAQMLRLATVLHRGRGGCNVLFVRDDL